MQPPPPLSPETLAAQALGEVDPVSGGLTPGINPSTSYEQLPDGSYRQDRVYTRADNPTYETAEGLLAALEGAGCACALFASGMAAATAIFQSLLPGDHVLVSRVLYWGCASGWPSSRSPGGWTWEFVDTGDHDVVSSAIRPGRTRLLWVEAPASPMWEITDLAGICELAHAAGVRVAVDNTVATPVLTRPPRAGRRPGGPFRHQVPQRPQRRVGRCGADRPTGSLLGADPPWRRNAGAVPGPFEAWLLQRGMRTLFLRVHRSSDSAMVIARHLHGHQRWRRCCTRGYRRIGPPDHGPPDPAGSAGCCRSAGGRPEQAMAVLGAVRVFQWATSLGGVESQIEHRRSQGGALPPRCLRTCYACRSASKPPRTCWPIWIPRSPQPIRPCPLHLSTRRARRPVPRWTWSTRRWPHCGAAAPLGYSLGAGPCEWCPRRGGHRDPGGARLPGRRPRSLALPIQELLAAAVPEITGVRIVGPHLEPPPPGRGERLADRVRDVLDAEDQPSNRGSRRSGDPGRGRPGLGPSSWRAAARAAAWRRYPSARASSHCCVGCAFPRWSA